MKELTCNDENRVQTEVSEKMGQAPRVIADQCFCPIERWSKERDKLGDEEVVVEEEEEEEERKKKAYGIVVNEGRGRNSSATCAWSPNWPNTDSEKRASKQS